MSTLKSSAEDLTLNADGSGNDVIIQSNASTKAIVTAEGNVGIGTTSPTYPLHIKSSATTTANFDAGSDGYDVQLRFEQNGTFVGAVGFDDSKDVVYLNRYGNATKGLTVDSSGDVTIPNATGASFILSREDTSNQTGDLIGAIGFRNLDTSSGTEPNYCGIKAKVSGGAGSDGELEFYTARNNYEADSGAAVIIRDTGVMELAINHLKFGTAGKGIDFSATSDGTTMTSEVLDDYEQGTWTPTLIGTSGQSGQGYGEQSGRYTKIGRLVHLEFAISLTAEGTFTGSYMKISGFPFDILSTPNTINLGQAYFVNMGQDIITMGFQGHEGTDSAYLWIKTSAGASREYLAMTGLTDNTHITGALTYAN